MGDYGVGEAARVWTWTRYLQRAGLVSFMGTLTALQRTGVFTPAATVPLLAW